MCPYSYILRNVIAEEHRKLPVEFSNVHRSYYGKTSMVFSGAAKEHRGAARIRDGDPAVCATMPGTPPADGM